VERAKNSKTDKSNEDEIDGDDKIEEPRHQQNENAREQCNDGGDVSAGNDHVCLQGNKQITSESTGL